MRRAAAIAAFCFLIAGSLAAAPPPPIRHVFIIVLENKGFDTTFGPLSPATYLSQTLTAQGQLLRNYYGIGHKSLPNYLAMVSGQGANGVTQADCLVYVNVFPGTQTSFFGQTLGQGCVYPAATKTIADQLTANGLTWKAYMQDIGIGTPCRRPVLNFADGTLSARFGDQYAARHNPFIYFQSLLDSGDCLAHDVDLEQLRSDLATAATTPNYAFIAPNLCEDGHDAPCVDGRPGGLITADLFLRTWVPRILSSPAMAENGLLIITFDEAGSADASACCNELPGLNTVNAGGSGPGGGRTGAVLISRFIQPGSVNDTPYNHYALLRSIQDLFALPHLGFAAQPDLKPFGADVYNAGLTPVRGRPSRP